MRSARRISGGAFASAYANQSRGGAARRARRVGTPAGSGRVEDAGRNGTRLSPSPPWRAGPVDDLAVAPGRVRRVQGRAGAPGRGIERMQNSFCVDVDALDHPKFVGLSAGAIWLWLTGGTYATRYQTDGWLPVKAIEGFRAYGRKRLDELVDAGLWDVDPAGGWRIHDYGDDNGVDVGEVDGSVEAPQSESTRSSSMDRRREMTRARVQRLRDRRSVSAVDDVTRNAESVTCNADDALQSVTESVTCNADDALQSVTSSVTRALHVTPRARFLVRTNTSTNTRSSVQKDPGTRSSYTGEAPGFADPFNDPVITERAARFLERYCETYQRLRNAKYLVRPTRDYASAVPICATWTDDERLQKLVDIFLTTNHEFAESGSRTVPQFAALASWCDGRLSEWEAKNRSKTDQNSIENRIGS